MRHYLFLLGLTLCLALAACSHPKVPTDQMYAAGFKKVWKDFLAYNHKLQNQEPPSRIGLTKDQHRGAVIAQVRLTGDGFQAIANEEAALRPTERFQALHNGALRLYQHQADLWHQWAVAMNRRDQTSVNSIGRQIDKVQDQDMIDLRFLTEAAFGGSPRADKAIAKFEQRNPIPGRPTTGPASEVGYVKAWSDIVYAYYEMNQDSSKRAPRRDHGMSEDQYNRVFGLAVTRVGNQIRAIASEEQLLQPPPSLSALHIDTLDFYHVQAQMCTGLGQAIVKGDRPGAKRITDELDNSARRRIAKIRADVAAVAPKDKNMETAVECLERTNGVPTVPDATAR